MDQPSAQTVVFHLDDECYGVDLVRVSEIIRPRNIRPLPYPDAEIMGLVDLRGKTVPVVDIRGRLRHEPRCDTESLTTRILVMDTDFGQLGMVVDAVTEVISIFAEDVEHSTDPQFVRGTARIDQRTITLLDPDKSLAA